jgi:hypothetical protein
MTPTLVPATHELKALAPMRALLAEAAAALSWAGALEGGLSHLTSASILVAVLGRSRQHHPETAIRRARQALISAAAFLENRLWENPDDAATGISVSRDMLRIDRELRNAPRWLNDAAAEIHAAILKENELEDGESETE